MTCVSTKMNPHLLRRLLGVVSHLFRARTSEEPVPAPSGSPYIVDTLAFCTFWALISLPVSIRSRKSIRWILPADSSSRRKCFECCDADLTALTSSGQQVPFTQMATSVHRCARSSHLKFRIPHLQCHSTEGAIAERSNRCTRPER